ncbi:hypothetical protein WR25_26577 [Diploscapter pachys]|uniref:MADF domain-containing protein n=1 Tax=Diploscapter pachys TaxID=2018661 RepID=A0A2A2KCC1_9BILA|nr:hypothetical protein WR25_26577 [Diploscapter pachys]
MSEWSGDPGPSTIAGILAGQVKEETEGELQSAGMEGSSNMVDWMNKIDSFDFAQDAEAPLSMADETKERMLELLREVEFRCIWDCQAMDFSNRNRKRAAYSKLRDRLHQEGHQVEDADWVRANYKRMNTIYARVRKQVEAQKGFVPKWRFYQLMDSIQPANISGQRRPISVDKPRPIPTTSVQNAPSKRQILIRDNKNASENWYLPFMNVNKNDVDLQPEGNSLFAIENLRDDMEASSSHESRSSSRFSPDTSEAPQPSYIHASALLATSSNPNSKKRKCETSVSEAHVGQSSSYLDEKTAKEHAGNLASTLVSLCGSLESKKAGSSAEICLGMSELIQKSIKKLYDV